MENFKTSQDEKSLTTDEQKAIDKQKKQLLADESKETILAGVEAFTGELLDKYPQVTEDERLNYYLSGSLAVMILLKAGKFEILDELRLPKIVPIDEKELPPEATKYLEGFVRKIGDLDFVETKLYAEQKKAVVNSYGKVPNEEYNRMRKQFLFKGGGGPQIPELSETAKKALNIGENQHGVMCDPLESAMIDRVARVKIGEREIYISEPKMMLAYKALHLGQTFENAHKTDKFVNDFNATLKGMETIYSRDELLQATHEILFADAPNSPNNTFIPYHNPKFKGELRKFYDEVLALDADFAYIAQLEYGKERSIGLLKVLHHYQSPEAKQAIVDFFNQHRAQIHKWSINYTSPQNSEIITDFLLSRPDLLADFQTYIKGEITRETIVNELKTQAWAFEKYGQQMSDKSRLEMRPRSSSTMDLLMKINEDNIHKELKDVSELLDLGTNELQLEKMLDAKYSSSLERRAQLLDGLKTARATLDDKDFEQFSSVIYKAVSSPNYFNSKSNSFINIKDEERLERIISIFEQFGVKF